MTKQLLSRLHVMRLRALSHQELLQVAGRALDALRLDMAHAVESGDMDRLRGAIDRLAPDYPALALALGYLARQYDYETIARLLSNAGGLPQKESAP